MLIASYPIELYYLVLLIGIPLAFLSPYKAFLLVSFSLAARHFSAAVQTRIFLGPYFNLNDALISIGILALLVNLTANRQKLRFPTSLALLFTILILSIANAYFLVGEFDINVIRYSKYALVFPILFLIAANFVTDQAKAKEFLSTLIVGAVAASVQHIFLSLQAYVSGMNIFGIRDIGFILHPGYYLLLTWMYVYRPKLKIALVTILSLSLFAASVILDQTRSVWIGMAGATILSPLVLKTPIKMIVRQLLVLPLLLLMLFIAFNILFPDASPLEIILTRFELISEQYSSGTNSRAVGAQLELDAWLSGNILIGQGLGSQAAFAREYLDDQSIAFGHVGYISYLTYTGILGFIVYSLILPIQVLADARTLLQQYGDSRIVITLAYMVTLGVIIHSIVALFTSAYIAPTNVGLIYGAVFGLRQYQKNNLNISQAGVNIASPNQHLSID